MSLFDGNTTPVSSCMYDAWTTQQHNWIGIEQEQEEEEEEDSPITTAPIPNNDKFSRPALREKNSKKNGTTYKHIPHKDKPAQVVARRNARERRRVQAVNGAFAKLRKAIPIENARGKRISKVKTLQFAIDYIQNLQILLQQDTNPPICYCGYFNCYQGV